MAVKQNKFAKVFKDFASLFIGMRISGKYLFKKTATVQYPDVRKNIPQRFRGILINDMPRCIVCDLCAKVCPVDCIDIKKVRGPDKKFMAEVYDIDLVKCLFCGLCTEACPTECLTMEGGYEGAVFDKKELYARFVKPAGEGKFDVYSKDEGWIPYDRAKEIMEKEEAEKKKNVPPKPAAAAAPKQTVPVVPKPTPAPTVATTTISPEAPASAPTPTPSTEPEKH